MAELVLGIVDGAPVADDDSGKWAVVRDEVDGLPIVGRKSADGWKGFVLANKEQASRCAHAAATYCLDTLECQEHGWTLQTTLKEKDATWIAWVRKIKLLPRIADRL
jgi:hypothetical protein